MAIVLVLSALASSVALLVRDLGIGTLPQLHRGVVSAVPLLFVGVAFLICQLILRPRLKEFLKNVLLAATFLLWGIVQLMPQSVYSIRLGSIVVVLYVVDLAWVILFSMSSAQESVPPRP
jgi:hypothetical protein